MQFNNTMEESIALNIFRSDDRSDLTEDQASSNDVESSARPADSSKNHQRNNSIETEGHGETTSGSFSQETILGTNEQNTPTEKSQSFSLFVVFFLPWTAGLALIVGVHVNSDVTAFEISPKVFHYYIVALIIVFMAWQLYGKRCFIDAFCKRCFMAIFCKICFKYEGLRNEETEEGENRSFEPLIDIHLLNGIAFFGVANSVFQVSSFLDIVKCSKRIPGLDVSYILVALMEMLFVYCQIYLFYRLSRERKQKIWFGNHCTMFTLAVNLTIWAGYFSASAVNHPDMKNVGWLRRYYYGLEEDLCATLNNTDSGSRKLHDIVRHMVNYKFTFAMEYSLLASALLLRIWRADKSKKTSDEGGTNGKWVIMRFGFIAGLFSLPMIGCVAVYSTVKYSFANITVLYVFKFVLFLLILVLSCLGWYYIKKHYTRDKEAKVLNVDIILLCLSSFGFLILDIFMMFAAIVEYQRKYILIGIASFVELVTVAVLTSFIVASYIHKVRQTPAHANAANKIRQISSCCLIVSFGFWAMRTYTFRSDRYFDYLGWKYFKTTWFAITQFATPLCIFYHFHCAVCLSAMIARSTGKAPERIEQNHAGSQTLDS